MWNPFKKKSDIKPNLDLPVEKPKKKKRAPKELYTGYQPQDTGATPTNPPSGGSGAKRGRKTLTPKELATANNEPYIAINKVELDPNNINNGAFDLDWNDKFVLNLIRAGYKIRPDDTDAQIVDRWFQTVCRNIALEVYEQEQADPSKRENEVRVIQSKDLGGGFSEVS